ncbi:hypothetical protein DFH09DRAFT_1083871 [Mycena vulgaris]|nr:hypothetical protein DFH09DRAFT_1083871 [Mycena vulgaris]
MSLFGIHLHPFDSWKQQFFNSLLPFFTRRPTRFAQTVERFWEDIVGNVFLDNGCPDSFDRAVNGPFGDSSSGDLKKRIKRVGPTNGSARYPSLSFYCGNYSYDQNDRRKLICELKFGPSTAPKQTKLHPLHHVSHQSPPLSTATTMTGNRRHISEEQKRLVVVKRSQKTSPLPPISTFAPYTVFWNCGATPANACADRWSWEDRTFSQHSMYRSTACDSGEKGTRKPSAPSSFGSLVSRSACPSMWYFSAPFVRTIVS